MSRPTGARGLKFLTLSAYLYQLYLSRPIGARGLKCALADEKGLTFTVASHRGAWIEIRYGWQVWELMAGRVPQGRVD